MNSKERLLNVLKGKPVDRVPISTYELVGWNQDSWENNEPSYKKLMDYIRKNTDCMHMISAGYDTFGGCETKKKTWQEGGSEFTRTTVPTPKGDLVKLTRSDENIKTDWVLEHLFKTPEDLDKYLSMPFENKEPDLTQYKKALENLGNEKGIVLFDFASPLCELADNFEFGEFTIPSVLNKDKITYFLDAIFERRC